LRISGVWDVPDKEVACANGLVFRHPDPRVIIGLAQSVMQFQFTFL
jgi:hypothetical protein